MIAIVRLRILGLGVGVVLLVLGVVLGTPAPASAPAAGPDDGLIHLGTEVVSDRVHVLRFSTPALTGPTQVRVLLPEGYDPSGATRYPVLYLHHGAVGNSTRWLELGGAAAATAGHDLIVVMPEGGLFGFYTDWWNHGAGGPPRWETYHLDQLLPWIDATYPTVASRDGRAIAGESMGGLGAMHYAAARPDLFTAAASFSGAIDTNYLLAPPIVEVAVMAEYQHLPAAAFGPRLTEEVRYRGHNPVDLAENLRGLLLQFDTGDGLAHGPVGGIDPVELAMHEMGLRMHERLDALAIAHTWHPFPGCHCWTDWARDLRALVPRLMARFADPAPAPSPFGYTSIDSSYRVYGWDVAVDRPAVEFSRLAAAGPEGFELTGSGAARVTTAALFEPGQDVAVTVTDADGTSTDNAVADGDGRLTVPVSLGPGNPFQQFSPPGTLWALAAGAPAGTWPSVTATVAFAPAPATTATTRAPTTAEAASGARPPAAPRAAAPAALPTTGAGTGPGGRAAVLVAAGSLVAAAHLRRRLRVGAAVLATSAVRRRGRTRPR